MPSTFSALNLPSPLPAGAIPSKQAAKLNF